MRFYIVIVFIILTLLNFTSCKDYLSEHPDQRLEVKTLESLAEILVQAYPQSSYLFLDIKTDDVVAIPLNNQKLSRTQNFQYKPVEGSDGNYGPNYFWEKSYQAIAHSNLVLEELDNVPNTDDDLKQSIKGEALITRAYNHFMLANIFCQHYSPSTANSMGIPYIKVPETVVNPVYSRGTLKETYQKIENDLLEALPLISNRHYKASGKYHFNIKASYAFASRFYLFKGDWDKCIKYSNKILGKGTVNSTIFKDLKKVFKGSNVLELSRKYCDIKDPSNLLLAKHYVGDGLKVYIGYWPTIKLLNTIYGKEDKVIFSTYNNIQGGNDLRNSPWGNSITGAYAPPKFGELFEYLTNNTGLPYYVHTLFRVEEVFFNRMESYIRKGMFDEALFDYNKFIHSRFENFLQLTHLRIVWHYERLLKTTTDEQAYIQFVIDERRKEFMLEGLRWFDIKRMNMAVKHIDVSKQEFNLKGVDLRKAIQIPPQAIAKGIKPNPR